MVDTVIPPGHKVRRSFSFWRGEKGVLNRGYREIVDRLLQRNYRVADFFFSLEQCLQAGRMKRVFQLAEAATVELMTHPVNPLEHDYLMSAQYLDAVRPLTVGTYSVMCQ